MRWLVIEWWVAVHRAKTCSDARHQASRPTVAAGVPRELKSVSNSSQSTVRGSSSQSFVSAMEA